MTEIDRHRRVQDLRALLHNLENYRDQEIDFDVDLARIPGFVQKDDRSKQHMVLGKLRERLFEISKRNRLLQFHATMQTVNLTHASVPLSFDITNIRPDQILVWNDSLQAALVGGEPVSLNKYLNFAEAMYLPSMLDRIMAEAQRDQAEFGFGQLRLVICFLHWANLKEKPVERFDSPLVLLPVELKKKKGIRDTYYLEAVSAEAEVNPVVRHQFKQLYDIDLPEVIDLVAATTRRVFRLPRPEDRGQRAGGHAEQDRPAADRADPRQGPPQAGPVSPPRPAGRPRRATVSQDLDYSYDQANYHPLGIAPLRGEDRAAGDTTCGRSSKRSRGREASPRPSRSRPPSKRSVCSTPWRRRRGEPLRLGFRPVQRDAGELQVPQDVAGAGLRDAAGQTRPINAAFDATFSLKPRAAERQLPPGRAAGRTLSTSCPPIPRRLRRSKRPAPARATSSRGRRAPGKSQTITNLIADFVARGKRVLFVCEKRAAIDVVYAPAAPVRPGRSLLPDPRFPGPTRRGSSWT